MSDIISLQKFEKELDYGLNKTYKRARKNGIARHTIKLSSVHKFIIKFRIDRYNTKRILASFLLNDVEFTKDVAIAKAKDLIDLTVRLADAEIEAAMQAKKKGAGRVVIPLGSTKRIVVLSRVSTRNQAGATFRYEMDNKTMQRERLFDFFHENGRSPSA